jgi:hypothetical protein
MIAWILNFVGFLVPSPISWFGTASPNSAAELGDSFGISNALFSALTLVVVVYAAVKQRQELEETQAALAEQTRQAKISQAEQTLFRMIENFQHLTMAIDLVPRSLSFSSKDRFATTSTNTAISRGPDALKVLLNRLEFSLASLKLADIHEADRLNRFRDCYERFYSEGEWELSHYLRSAYNIYRFIDSSELINKEDYIRIFRANHSKAELGILFYNALSVRGEKFKLLIEKYQILKHVSKEDKNSIRVLYNEFAPTAFQK